MENRERPSSPDHSCVSLKSDGSMAPPPKFSNDPVTSDPSICSQRSSSPDHSCVSLKSDRSMPLPPKFSDEPMTSDPRISSSQRSSSPDPSCVSLKSDRSMPLPPKFSDEPITSDPRRRKRQRSSSPEPSCVSLKSERSMPLPPKFSDEPVTSEPSISRRRKRQRSPEPMQSLPSKFSDEAVTSDTSCHDQNGDQDPPQPVDDELQRVKYQHKTSMKIKYERLFDGTKLQENESLLNRIYTQLYIIEGESEGVNEEHEFLQMEKTARTQHSQDTPIYCNDIFKASAEPGCEEKDQIKTVLTKGIAGIGKTVSVQKFILDWAEGKANQDVDFMFVLPFRELNLIRDRQYSLHRLLLDFHPELQDLDSKIYEECKVVFLFDGLDESRNTLMFSDDQKVCDVTETSSVGVLMSKLMKGELLPSALIWITSRPAAANQIPSKYINRLTEIQGFNEPQKEEYFRKRISDQHQASRIISHIRRARSLHIMCHIPVFCWISSTVLQKLLEEDLSAEIPQTLTEMYIHFLLIQINTRNQKYEERDPEKLLQSNREMIVKLAEVAFKQLMKGNVMFYEEDLIESGIDVTDASVYSGICTEIFKEESVIHQRKVYSFVHLSVQEFLTAFYVIYCHLTKNNEPLQVFLRDLRIYRIYEDPLFGLQFPGATNKHDYKYRYDNHVSDTLHDLLRSAVIKALQSENGRLDLFLRFLLGVSLESNQRLLQDLLTHTENSSESIRETTQYIKEKIKFNDNFYNPSAAQSINLFLCLLEVKDQTLSREIQEFVKSDKHSEKLSPARCSTIAYILQMSEEPLDDMDFKKYTTSVEGRTRLIPAVINCRKALLSGCNFTAQHCEIVSLVLQSSNCILKDLDLSNNDLQDSGVKLLSDELKCPNCQLEILRLSGCSLADQSCESLSSALQSSNCVLRELDLSNNDLQDSGVKLLSDGLKSPNCQLQILSLSGCNLIGQHCESLSSALQSSNCVLRELDLSNNDLQDSGVKLLSDGLKSPNCQLQILRLSGCMVSEEGCGYLSSALSSNPSHLRELDLSYNHPGQSRVQLISDKLQDPNYKLQILNVDHGGDIRMTAGLQKYACDLTLDPNTAHTQLILSDENRKVTRVEEHQPYPDHPERFKKWYHVLCRESLTGRCYWEAEWSGSADISVSYKGKDGMSDFNFGWNDKSWNLNCSSSSLSVRHNKNYTDIPAVHSSSNRVGVYLDWSSGSLSFYSVSDTHTLTHLHTFNTTFTEPLYTVFTVYSNSSVALCQIKQQIQTHL
ncbi:NACHT, LRR and PYD domains-containing protein 12-like isoform X2 [Onychostoma macrolepis]|uniref:NACHT, LRR and PYD domains-containing protein 12-like isoform X2 n=1 Tax=Onychostoma macrolepis TaxID=369639 RepID=UPI00272B2228|nr:NACHT, LRR and PYD domains-containing protein 12-like isoform X2 [Onychostoma macrolepis]